MASSNALCALEDVTKNSQIVFKQLTQGYDNLRWLSRQDRLPAEFKTNKALSSATQLLDETIEHGREYMFTVLPEMSKTVKETKSQFELLDDVYKDIFYLTNISSVDVDHEIVASLLQDIANANKPLCSQTNINKKKVLTELKRNEDASKRMASELDKEQEISSEKAKGLRSKAGWKKNLALGCAICVPVIGAIPAAFMNSSASNDCREADHHEKTSIYQGVYEKRISSVLQPGLESLITHYSFTTGTISMLDSEAEQLCKASTSLNPGKIKINLKKVHDNIQFCQKLESLMANSTARLLTF